MAGRSPARFLAPLALVAFAVALFLVVSSSQPDSEREAGPNRTTNAQPTSSPDGEQPEEERPRKGPRFYTVKPGDTPSSIAEETGVTLEELLRLNEDLDPQTLTVGQRLRLRR
jgi:LysM repeat protein